MVKNWGVAEVNRDEGQKNKPSVVWFSRRLSPPRNFRFLAAFLVVEAQMKSTRLKLLLAIILLAGSSVFGQTQPNLENGYKAYGSYDGSNIDTINTMNGNLMLHLPMPFSYPQRGGKLNLVNLLTVTSKNWSVQCDPAQNGSTYPLNCY